MGGWVGGWVGGWGAQVGIDEQGARQGKPSQVLSGEVAHAEVQHCVRHRVGLADGVANHGSVAPVGVCIVEIPRRSIRDTERNIP